MANVLTTVSGPSITDDTVTEADLDIHAAPTGTDKFLKYTSNGMEWVVPSYVANTDTTYAISCVDGDNSDEEKIRLTAGGSGSGTDDIVLEAGTGLSIARSSDKITFTNTVTNTNTNILSGGTIAGDVVFDNATNSGMDMTWDESEDSLILKDDVQLSLGTGRDMRFYHTGSHGYLNVVTGNLNIRTNGSESAIICTANAGVDLYYDTAQEFATVQHGVKLYGRSEAIVHGYGNTSGSITIDFNLANHFSITATGNLTFANPTTENIGQSGTITITQDGTGGRTAGWNSNFKWAGGSGSVPILTSTASAVDRIDYVVVAADHIHCVASLAMAN